MTFLSTFNRHVMPAVLAVSVLGLSPMTGIAHAEGPGDWKARHEAQEAKILDQLNLTAEQRQKIQAIKQASREEAKQHHQKMRSERQAFEDYIFSPNANQQTAEAKVDGFSRDMSEMGKLRVRTLFKMKAVMTPEQFQKFGQLQKERRAAKMQRHHKF